MGNDKNFLTSIDRLKGRENYGTWKFAMQTYLEYNEIWNAVLGTETNNSKITKARTSIILSVDASVYVHVQDASTAKEVWEKLKSTFEDKGRARRITLVRQLTDTKLTNCSSMETYVSTIITAAQRLNAIGFKVEDEWLAIFLMCGLSDQYTPMIMALDNVDVKLSSDAIKTKLLQEVPVVNDEGAFFSGNSLNKKAFSKKKGIRCYSCNKIGHKSPDCPLKKSKKMDDKNESGVSFNAIFIRLNLVVR